MNEGEINRTAQFNEDNCVTLEISGTLNKREVLSYEAYIDDDPDICYRTYGVLTYNGN